MHTICLIYHLNIHDTKWRNQCEWDNARIENCFIAMSVSCFVLRSFINTQIFKSVEIQQPWKVKSHFIHHCKQNKQLCVVLIISIHLHWSHQCIWKTCATIFRLVDMSTRRTIFFSTLIKLNPVNKLQNCAI